jgi:hypothetical protein
LSVPTTGRSDVFLTTLLSNAQLDRLHEIAAGTHPEGYTFAGVELNQPFMTSIISITPVYDRGEDYEGDRYEFGSARAFLVCGKDVTDEYLAAEQAGADATEIPVQEVEA